MFIWFVLLKMHRVNQTAYQGVINTNLINLGGENNVRTD